MKPTPTAEVAMRVVLAARTAQDMMAPNPVSIHERNTVREAAGVLTDREINAAPVINDAGRAVGVVTRADVVRYVRETTQQVRLAPGRSEEDELTLESGEVLTGFQIEEADTTPVRDIMTPLVFSVGPDEPAIDVILKMLAQKVHRVFVVDTSGVLVGVVSAFDVLRKLQSEG